MFVNYHRKNAAFIWRNEPEQTALQEKMQKRAGPTKSDRLFLQRSVDHFFGSADGNVSVLIQKVKDHSGGVRPDFLWNGEVDGADF